MKSEQDFIAGRQEAAEVRRLVEQVLGVDGADESQPALADAARTLEVHEHLVVGALWAMFQNEMRAIRDQLVGKVLDVLLARAKEPGAVNLQALAAPLGLPAGTSKAAVLGVLYGLVESGAEFLARVLPLSARRSDHAPRPAAGLDGVAEADRVEAQILQRRVAALSARADRQPAHRAEQLRRQVEVLNLQLEPALQCAGVASGSAITALSAEVAATEKAFPASDLDFCCVMEPLAVDRGTVKFSLGTPVEVDMASLHLNG